MQPSTLAPPSAIAIAGVTHPVIQQYFDRLNAADFVGTAQLFTPDGLLHPPFEQPVVGRDAIATYLTREAQQLRLVPTEGHYKMLDNGCTEYQVVGQVHTPFFSVRVCWQMVLSPWSELFLVKIDLLASMQELFNLRQHWHGTQKTGAN